MKIDPSIITQITTSYCDALKPAKTEKEQRQVTSQINSSLIVTSEASILNAHIKKKGAEEANFLQRGIFYLNCAMSGLGSGFKAIRAGHEIMNPKVQVISTEQAQAPNGPAMAQ